MRRLALAIAAVTLLAGCGSGSADRGARDAALRFETALAARDGAGACEQLAEEAASKLEQSEKQPCERAILSAELTPAREVVGVSTWVTSGQVVLDGDTLFLDDTSRGWKVAAAGCRPTAPREPYDCELEG